MLATAAAAVIYSEDFIQLQEAGEARAIFTCLSPYYLRENSPSAPSGDLQLQLWTELGYMHTCSYNDSCESQDLSRRMKLA